MARKSRDMMAWTFYAPRAVKELVAELAVQASKIAGRRIRPSAVARALVTRAVEDPEMVQAAVQDAATEPPSGPARSGMAAKTVAE